MKKRIDLNLNDYDIDNLDLLCKIFECKKSELVRWFITNATKSSTVMKQFCKDTGRDFARYHNGYYSQFNLLNKNDEDPRFPPRDNSPLDNCCKNSITLSPKAQAYYIDSYMAGKLTLDELEKILGF